MVLPTSFDDLTETVNFFHMENVVQSVRLLESSYFPFKLDEIYTKFCIFKFTKYFNDSDEFN